MKQRGLFLTIFCLFFVILAVITFFKTRSPAMQKQILEDFGNFYLEQQLEKGLLLTPIEELMESTKNEESIEYVVKRNDTLEGIFFSFDFSNADYKKVLTLLNKDYKNLKLFVGQKLFISYTTVVDYGTEESEEDSFLPFFKSKNQTNTFKSLSFQTQDGVAEVFREGDNFELKFVSFQKTKRLKFKSVDINLSLYEDGIKAGLTPNLLEKLIRLYSFDVDFQRDIRAGDSFSVLYEEIYDDNTGKKLLDGDILYSKIDLVKSSKRDFSYYLFNTQYYDENGNTSAKSFLKTPISGARLSSGFGLRKHPILGFTKLHTGLDFAAPTGTPIFASASGTITFIGWNGTQKTGYGRRIVISHNSTYSSTYSHLHGFRKNLIKGSKVKQGEVIGYVGSTGYSTGPHLHYEVIKNGALINPKNVSSFTTEKLSGVVLKEFFEVKKNIIQKRDELSK
jgi:murein DD-endopeptidase MepM/ murein hydrolase activator NlpD